MGEVLFQVLEVTMNDASRVTLEAELLSVRRLAQVLDCSPKTVQDWLYKDRKKQTMDPLPYYRLGGLVRFRVSEVLDWIERRRVRVGLKFVK
jgi:excisionase family DNA binding protein